MSYKSRHNRDKEITMKSERELKLEAMIELANKNLDLRSKKIDEMLTNLLLLAQEKYTMSKEG